MTTYVFTRTASSGWSPRTSYSDNHEGARRKILPVIAEEFEHSEGEESVRALPTGVLFVYFAGGKTPGGEGPQNMPEVFEYKIERFMPKLVRVV